MNSGCNTQTILAIIAGCLIIYLLISNTEMFTVNNSDISQDTSPDTVIGAIDEISEEDALISEDQGSMASDETAQLMPLSGLTSAGGLGGQSRCSPATVYSRPARTFEDKVRSRNHALPGQTKKIDYVDGDREQKESSNWDNYFESSNNLIGGSLMKSQDGSNYMPIDETNDQYALFRSNGKTSCGSNQNCDPEDLFDVDKYLPQEVTDDWFEVQPEPISVKNRCLINVIKPIGINTVGTSLRNSSYDIRGAPSCPKSVVSPFLNSSIEPDLNYKPLA